ncbi:MAG: ankyrin repeat domain-containing protein [Verrucomicrobiae bacterium]|nr:ankyrin repeat domain-containing protein [Verrucomicrobiae bacterium]NNJ85876.1 ankyrin repeat domain-containing protein [Akkermansiaceae bacterium]
MKIFIYLLGLVLSSLYLVSCSDKKEQASKELETSGYQATPADFLRAAENGDIRALKLFAKQEIDLNTKDSNGWTALHLAARAQRQESVAFLLDAGMDIETPGLDGVTPMMLAAREGHHTMVRYLLKQGAKAELKDDKNRSALILAIDGDHASCVEELAPYSRNQLDTALLYAAAQGKHQVIESLTSFGASVYVRHEGGMTPLMLAAENGHIDTVKSLLESGANRYAVNEHGWTAAQVAEAANQSAIAGLLNQNPDSTELAITEPSVDQGVEWTPPVIAAADMPQAEPDAEKTEDVKTKPTDSATPNTDVTAGNPTTGTATTPNKLERTSKPAKKHLPFIAGKTISSKGTTPDEVASDLNMLDYQQKPLPLMVEKTSPRQEGGAEAHVRMLYGDHQQVTVEEGDTIPSTQFKVISIRRMLNHSKITDGKPADVSVVEIEDTTTGQRRKMTAHIPATAADPWAVLRSKSSGRAYAARAGQQFRTADGQTYTVSDVRPNQIILTQNDTGEATTIPLGRN